MILLFVGLVDGVGGNKESRHRGRQSSRFRPTYACNSWYAVVLVRMYYPGSKKYLLSGGVRCSAS